MSNRFDRALPHRPYLGLGNLVSWIIGSGVAGLLMGFASKNVILYDGTFSMREVASFNISEIIAHAVAWIVVAPPLDMLIYSEPLKKAYVQGIAACLSNIVTTAIVGTLFCYIYVKAWVETNPPDNSDN